MSRRTINLSIIVLGIILLNSLAFIGAGADPIPGTPLPGSTANHRQIELGDVQTQASVQASPSRANHHPRDVEASMQAAAVEPVPSSVAAVIDPTTGDQSN